MTTYKSFMNAARVHFSSSPFLRGLVSGHLVVFIFGAVAYLLGAFLINLRETSAFSCYDSLTAVGIVFAIIGLGLSVLADDAMGIVIVSSVISVGALVAWILILVTGGYIPFTIGPLFYCLVFAAVATVAGVKSEKFKQMRAAAAARAQMAVMPCPNCGAFVPMNAAFCPNCGAQKPVVQYAPPVQYQAPPVQYQAAPVQYQAAPVQYAPPAQPVQAPAAPPMPETAAVKCAGCGAELPAGAAFCSKCGAKQ